MSYHHHCICLLYTCPVCYVHVQCYACTIGTPGVLTQHGAAVVGVLRLLQACALHAPGTLTSAVLQHAVPWAAAAVRERDGDLVKAGSVLLTQLAAVRPAVPTRASAALNGYFTQVVRVCRACTTATPSPGEPAARAAVPGAPRAALGRCAAAGPGGQLSPVAPAAAAGGALPSAAAPCWGGGGGQEAGGGGRAAWVWRCEGCSLVHELAPGASEREQRMKEGCRVLPSSHCARRSPGVQDHIISADQKQRFVRLLCQRPPMELRRFQALGTDFAHVFRLEGSADVVLGYEL